MKVVSTKQKSAKPKCLLCLYFQVSMVCGSIESLHSALVTLVQLLRVCTTTIDGNEKSSVPPVVITDQPSLVHRGVLLDLSPHARVPTLVSMELDAYVFYFCFHDTIFFTACSKPSSSSLV